MIQDGDIVHVMASAEDLERVNAAVAAGNGEDA